MKEVSEFFGKIALIFFGLAFILLVSRRKRDGKNR